MKKILLAGILILLLFVGTAAAVSVDYAQKQGISISTARDNANSALVSYVAMSKLGTSAALWNGSSISPTPLMIYDQSGIVYSYLFDVITKDGKIIGTVNAAGNKLVGKPIVSIEKSPVSFDYGLIITKVSELAEKAYADARIDNVVFIMGKDQKIGVMVILTEQDGVTRRLTYDLRTFQLQSERISYPGLINAATPSSVFVSMSSSSATQAIQNYDSKTKFTARVIPVVRRTIPVFSPNSTINRGTGISTVKSVEKGYILSGRKPAPSLQKQIPIYSTTRSINTEVQGTSSLTGQRIPASRF
jgi:hypothetical protein